MFAEAATSGWPTLIVAQAQETLDQQRILDRLVRAERKTRYQREPPWRTRAADENARRGGGDPGAAAADAAEPVPPGRNDPGERRHRTTRTYGGPAVARTHPRNHSGLASP